MPRLDQSANLRIDEIISDLEPLQEALSADGFDAYTDTVQDVIIKLKNVQALINT